MKKKPKVFIEQSPQGYYRIYQLEKRWFGLIQEYDYVETAYNLEDAERFANIILNPIVKEYYE